MARQNKILLFSGLVVLIASFFLSFGESPTNPIDYEKQEKLVTRVLDGDTVIIDDGSSVRLLGIDTDEKGGDCFELAKNRLEDLVLDKKVILESNPNEKDIYGRRLGYIFIDDLNVNLQMVIEGLAVPRFFSDSEKYHFEIVQAGQAASEGRIGCQWLETTENSKQSFISRFDSETTINVCETKQWLNQEITVQGEIIEIYEDSSANFFNFGAPYPNQCFSAVIWNNGLLEFPEILKEHYQNKTVKIKGKITEYNGQPQIILQNLEQIKF